MAATLQHCNTATSQSPLKSTATSSPNPQLKRLVYSKYRELLGSYNDQANAYIDTLPSYMVHKDNGFNIEMKNVTPTNNNAHAAATANANATTATINLTTTTTPSPPPSSAACGNEMYGSGQRMPGQSTYEAPACVQNAMNRDKKPFTYTPGGIDLSQIKSERMAKRLARNACIEGAAGQSQQNRPTQPMSPCSPGGAAAAMGAAAMGMPFQVLPPSPHPTAGKNLNGGSAPAPPPPPPSSSNFLNTGKPQTNGVNGGSRNSAPPSPNMPRKAPAGPPQRFEPPPLGFRPEIKIPTNPMAALRKVAPPVEKNTFWKEEYKKNKGVTDEAASVSPNSNSNNNNNYYNTEANDSVNSSSSSTPQTNASNGTEYIRTNGETNDNSDTTDGFKRAMPTTTTNRMQPNQQTTNTTNNQEQEEAIKTPPSKPSTPPSAGEADKSKSQSQSPREASQDTLSITSMNSNRPTPPTSPSQQQQQQLYTNKPNSPSQFSANRSMDRQTATPPATVASPPKPLTPPSQYVPYQAESPQKQQTPKPEFRSVAAAAAAPAPPAQSAVNVFTRQTDSPRSVENATPPRVSESPFKYAQQQQQQRAPVTMSPLAQQTTPSSTSSGNSISPNPPQAQSVPWRTQRGQTPQKQQTLAQAPVAQAHPQPYYNNVQQQQQQQQQQTPRAPDFSTQTSPYQGPKPTNVGSLYIAPLAQPPEPQAQHIVRQQQLQQQQQQQQPQRDSPMRQLGNAAANAQPNLRWMSAQPKQTTEQPAWVRPEENGNVMPSSLNRLKSPPPPPPEPISYASQQQAKQQKQQQLQQQQQQQQQLQQQQQSMYQPLSMNQGNGFMNTAPHNFGAHPVAPTGLRLQINTQSIQNPNNQTGPRERIIPIQLEQTPTYTPSNQPSFETPSAYGAGSVSPAPGYVMRTPNQFVDQGYNNYGPSQPQRVMSPPMQQQQQQQQPQQQQQQLNAPRMVQQQQQQSTVSGGARTHIIPIAIENSEGTRGPISKAPIVIQNDLRTPPVQSKSFRILQKITDTIDDGSNDESGNTNQQRNDNYMDAEPQLQRPTFARQMSAQQARNSPTVEQMRRMKIAHEQGNNSLPQTPSQFNQQPRPFYNNNSNDYIPPSEQHVPEPKKYTGSAIPSRSFKILQAMTQPENAGGHDNSHEKLNDETKSENNESYPSSSSIEPESSSSTSSLNSVCASSTPTPPPSAPQSSAAPPLSPSSSSSSSSQTMTSYPQYPYPYGYPWYPPPPPPHCRSMTPQPNGETAHPANWPYPYGMAPPPAAVSTSNGEVNNNPPSTNWPYPGHAMPPHQRSTTPVPDNPMAHPYPPYPYFYPYPYAIPPPYPPPTSQSGEFLPYMPPPMPYHAYPYPVAPSYSQSSTSSAASSVLPDIIITPSTDDVSSKMIMQHHIKVEKEKPPKKSPSVDIEHVTTTINPKAIATPKPQEKPSNGSIFEVLNKQLQSLNQTMENNLNSSSLSTKKSYTKNFDQKSPDDNTSPVQIAMLRNGKGQGDPESDSESSDSDVTTTGKDDAKSPTALQSIRSVSNIQYYNGNKNVHNKMHDQDSEDDDEDTTTAEGESDTYDEDEEEATVSADFENERSLEHPDTEGEDLYEDEDSLSVIYEEESDYEKTSENNKPFKKLRKSGTPLPDLSKCIEDNDSDEEEKFNDDDADAENSVTVSLPLKFSFTKSSNDEPIATVEVGKSLVEDRRNSLTLSEKRNSFSVATVNDSDGESDSCDVSVTISLSNSSPSGSVESKDGFRNMADKYPIDDMPIPEHTLPTIESSVEHVSCSLSLNKRNKFVKQTLQGDITNNIAKKSDEDKVKQPVRSLSKSKLQQSTEELDFFATLMATKKQAQKIKDQTASYWGKSLEKKEEKEETCQEDKADQNPKTETKSSTPKKQITEKDSNSITPKAGDTNHESESKLSAPAIGEVRKEVEIQKTNSNLNLDELKARTSFWASFPTSPKTSESEKTSETTPKPTELKESKPKEVTTSAKPKEVTTSPKPKEVITSPKPKEVTTSPKPKEVTTSSKPKEVTTSSWEEEDGIPETPTYKPSAEKVSKDVENKNVDDLKARTSFWSNFSTKKTPETQEVTETKLESPPQTDSKRNDVPSSPDISSKAVTYSDTTDISSPNTADITSDTAEISSSNTADTTSKPTTETETNQSEAIVEESDEIDDIWADRDDDYVPPRKSTYNYWDRYSYCSEATTETKDSGETEEQTESVAESKDSGETQEETETVAENTQKEESTQETSIENEISDTKNEPELLKVETPKEHTVAKPKKALKKSKLLESAKNSFWSTVAETQKPVEEITFEIEKPKRKFTTETMQEKNFSAPVLRHRFQELTRCQTPLIHFEWESNEDEDSDKSTDSTSSEEEEEDEEEEDDEEKDSDFWSKLEESQQSPVQCAGNNNKLSLLAEDADNASFWNIPGDEQQDSEESAVDSYDPMKYPAEPREVDTDEEIDFWAEIDAKRNADDDSDDLTFHRAATFWATQDQKNSDETPFTPVLPKPFKAKLPDEPATQDHNVWTALEAHKGEEPLIIDPEVEEEKELVQEFDDMSPGPDHNCSMFDLASVHSAVVASVWQPPQRQELPNVAPAQENFEYWPEIDRSQEECPLDVSDKPVPDNDEIETKRNNYRKAMAFFTTSIDEHKVEGAEAATEITPTVTAQPKEENWNWEAPPAVVKEEPKQVAPKLEEPAKKSKKPPKKEKKPKTTTKCKSPPLAVAEESRITELPQVYVEPTLDFKPLPLDPKPLSNGLPDLGVEKFTEEPKVSVRDRISVFETGSFDAPDAHCANIPNQSLSVDSSSGTRQSSLSRNSSTQRSESEIEEDDSGVTDMNKLSETETDTDSFPELRKMSSYQRAATHSRLYKLLQDDTEIWEELQEGAASNEDDMKLRPSRKKVIHNVSITRKQNPNLGGEVETLSQRRERLSLPLRKNGSIDADNPSTPNSPASPIMNESSANQSIVSDKLVSELVQSLLLKSDSTHLRKLPMEKLQAAAKRVLEEELDSLENTSVESTPSMTPSDVKKDKSYADYYNTWSDAKGTEETVPSKSFRALQDTRRSPWTARCPRVLSSKTINRDLTRVSESPEMSLRSSKSQSREGSVSRWRKV